MGEEMNWFGEPWPRADFRAPVCEDDALRVPPPPPGEECVLCGHPIQEGDRGLKIPHMAAPRADGLLTYEWRYCHIEDIHRNIGIEE